MIAKVVGISFNVQEDESLMKLVTKCEYSKPTKDDPVARRELFGYGEGSGEDINPVAEVTRKNKDLVYVTIKPGSFENLVPHIVTEVWGDLETAGLV